MKILFDVIYENKNLCPHKDFYTKVQKGLIHNSPKLITT